MPRLLLVTLAALLAAPSSAQDADTPLVEGAHALQFLIAPSLDLEGAGSSLGIKWHQSETRATHLTLSADAGGNVFRQDAGDNANSQDVRVALTYVPMRYRRSRTPVYLYTGIGPLVSAQLSRSAQGDRENVLIALEAGATGVVGVEWVVASAVSLTADYRHVLAGSVAFREGGDAYRLRFASLGARAGVNVYF